MQVYAQTPFAHGFGEISDELGLYRGSIKNYEAIIADLRGNEGDGGIDVVIFPTSIIEWVRSSMFLAELQLSHTTQLAALWEGFIGSMGCPR